MINLIKGQKLFSVTHTHTTAAKAEQAAPGAGKRILITDIIVSSDKAGSIVTVKEDSGGGSEATLFQLQIGANHLPIPLNSPIVATANLKVAVEIDGTSICKANLVGIVV